MSHVEQYHKVLEGFWDWVAEQHAGLRLEMKKHERHCLELAPLIESAQKRGVQSDEDEEFATTARNYFLIRSQFKHFDALYLDAFGQEQTTLPDTATARLLWEWYCVEGIREVKGGEA